MHSQALVAFLEELEKSAAPALQGFKQPGLRGILPSWAMPKPPQRTVGQLTSNVTNAPKPLITYKPGRPAAPLVKMALPHYEREIAAGNIPRAALAPAVPGAPRSLPTAQRLSSY